MIKDGTSVRGQNRQTSKERGPGAWHPTLFAANIVACLRTVPIAPLMAL
jgi:hypothetical protein